MSQIITATDHPVVAVLGLGYVGLPLSVAFAKVVPTIGFDINAARVAELAAGRDSTGELLGDELDSLKQLELSSNKEVLRRANVYIVAVPTPVNADRTPDLQPMLKASRMIASVLKPGDLVIYESTVYPGCTEDECVPELESGSKLVFNQDFFVGYSPERINPGDRARRLQNIVKVTSGSTQAAAQVVDALYRRIILAGTHLAKDIRTAEAAKVIENTQRDVSIALINELAIIFAKLGMDTQAVLDAAATKWNFINLRPGLVGGHCIGVDPYYLIKCSQQVGVHPELIATARRINESMPRFISDQILRIATKKGILLNGARALMMGISFKEDCPDLRNTKVVDLKLELQSLGITVDVHDPHVDANECAHEYGFQPIAQPQFGCYDLIVLAVAHREFRQLGALAIRQFGKPKHVLYDIKHILTHAEVDGRL